jgi:acylphosphatase
MGETRMRLSAVVTGRVQGVGFRWSVRRRAQHLGLSGYAANRADGTVEVEAEGTPSHLDELEEFLHMGPPGAGVAEVSARRGEPTGEFHGFVTK